MNNEKKTATSEPVAIYQIWDNGPAMWSDVSQDQYNRCNRAERRIVYTAPAPQQASPLTDAPELIAKLERVSKWINKFPVPTEGATAMMRHIHDVQVRLLSAGSAASAGDARDGQLVPLMAEALKDAKKLLELNGVDATDMCDYGNGRADHIVSRISSAIDRAAMAATKERNDE